MRDYDSISEIEMDNKTYAVVENVNCDGKDYLLLVNQNDNEDMLCLRAKLDDRLKLDKLDSETELTKVLECICKKYGINAE